MGPLPLISTVPRDSNSNSSASRSLTVCVTWISPGTPDDSKQDGNILSAVGDHSFAGFEPVCGRSWQDVQQQCFRAVMLSGKIRLCLVHPSPVVESNNCCEHHDACDIARKNRRLPCRTCNCVNTAFRLIVNSATTLIV